jgi:hypothetical protein
MEYRVILGTENVKIEGINGDRVLDLTMDRRVWDFFQTCTSPTSNGDMQQGIARALRLNAPGGRCAKAASILERYTNGYRAFNGWCAVLVGTSEGRKRFFQFNPNLTTDDTVRANMLTKTGKLLKPNTADATPRRAVPEDLDLPEGYEPSSEDMNFTIDEAYRALGFNPDKLTDDAPDLTYEEALEVLSK